MKLTSLCPDTAPLDGDSRKAESPKAESSKAEPPTTTTAPLEIAGRRRSRWLGMGLLVAGSAVALWALGLAPAVTDSLPGATDRWSPQELGIELWADRVRALGWLAYPAFAIAYALALAAALPAAVMTAAAVWIFGFSGGFLVAMAGAALGASLSFAVARIAGRRRLERWLQARPRLQRLDGQVERHGAVLLLLLRLLPSLPMPVINYVCGLTRISYPTYLVCTVVGLAPPAAAYCWSVHQMLGVAQGDPWLANPQLWAALACLGTLIVGLPTAARWAHRRSGGTFLGGALAAVPGLGLRTAGADASSSH